MYVLDTNTLIYFFKGIGNVGENLLASSPKEIAIPAIVLFELEYGIAKSTSPKKRRDQLTTLCESVNILPFGQKESGIAAGLRFELERAGTPIGPYDILIAATVLSHNGVLVSNNTKEFERITKLQLINWL
jgi:tRNA(fMet)-specific endonuclease VapC